MFSVQAIVSRLVASYGVLEQEQACEPAKILKPQPRSLAPNSIKLEHGLRTISAGILLALLGLEDNDVPTFWEFTLI